MAVSVCELYGLVFSDYSENGTYSNYRRLHGHRSTDKVLRQVRRPFSQVRWVSDSSRGRLDFEFEDIGKQADPTRHRPVGRKFDLPLSQYTYPLNFGINTYLSRGWLRVKLCG